MKFSSEVHGDEGVGGVVDDLHDGPLDGIYDGE